MSRAIPCLPFWGRVCPPADGAFLLTRQRTILRLEAGRILPSNPTGSMPQRAITDITYMKPRVVRMIETFMGKERCEGLDLYHRRVRHGNATREQWIQAMEEVSGQISPLWLRDGQTDGFPRSREAPEPPSRLMTLNLRQSADDPAKRWIFPVRSHSFPGMEMTLSKSFTVSNGDETLELHHQNAPLPVDQRGFSFYGRSGMMRPGRTVLQRKDRDLVNRYMLS